MTVTHGFLMLFVFFFFGGGGGEGGNSSFQLQEIKGFSRAEALGSLFFFFLLWRFTGMVISVLEERVFYYVFSETLQAI